MAKRKLSNQDVWDAAIAIVKEEKMKYENAVCFVTDRVSFQMRYLLRQLRKNYWGIFDSPNDPTTGRMKTWVPLTQSFVENVVKSIDLDTKDINFRAKNPKGYAITDVTRAAVRDYLEKDEFGEKLDKLERDLCIDGTVVWKTYEVDGKLKTKQLDLQNCYIEPTEETIQSAYRFTERSLQLPTELEQMSGWYNTDDLAGSKNLARMDSQQRTISTGTTADYRDTWEMWGRIPKSLITRDPADEKEFIHGHIVISGLEVGGPTCHLVEENKKEDGLKPYEEVRYTRVNNRWYGVGIAEKLMWLQIWLNTIVNIRINRSYVTQLGLYKIKKGSGITPAMLSRLSANGAILVTDMGDIEPLETPSGDNASYQDERVITDWAQKATLAYDISVGGDTPASSSATATSIQNNNGKSAFTLVKETIGMFLERWLDRHALPVIAKSVAKGDVIHFSDNDAMFKEVVQNVVAFAAQEKLEEMEAQGFVPTDEIFFRELKNAEEKILKKKGFFVKVIEEIIADNLATKVYITNEEMDIGVMVNNLIQTLQIAPEYKDATIKEIFSLMGLQEPRMSPAQQAGAQPAQMVPQGKEAPTAQQITTNANVPSQQNPMATGAPGNNPMSM